MNIPGLARARYSVRRLARKFQRQAIVLLYHRVGESLIDPQLLGVSKECFEQHMDHLARRYSVISVRELAQALADGVDIPHHSVAVTFDDGYADNLANAKPILDKYRVPATVFVTSGYLGQDREFWWDELERVLLHASTLPGTLRLHINGKVFERNLGGAARYSAGDYAQYRTWNVVNREDPTVRHAIYRDLCRILRPLVERERNMVMSELRSWSGVQATAREARRCLTQDEVKQLVIGDLIEVGGHTVTHSVLSGLSSSEQIVEIGTCKAHMEGILGRPVTTFAYPYGTKSDYTDETAERVREAGFAAACANIPDVVTKKVDRYQMPRFIVRDWGRDTFAQALKFWFSGTTRWAPDAI